jgi:ribosomal protein S18 acetylase RimI-like enzyme
VENKRLLIRKAVQQDAAAIVVFILYAMENIVYEFINEVNYEKASAFLAHFVAQEKNQYSYQNCLVATIDNVIVGAALCYDGADLIQLRKPIIAYVKIHYNVDFDPPHETQAGEIYIDCIGVDVNYRGQGVGNDLVKHVLSVNQNKTVGLLVDERNIAAYKLYRSHGFIKVGEKVVMLHVLDHLQLISD